MSVVLSSPGGVLIPVPSPTLTDLALASDIFVEWDEFVSGTVTSGGIGKLGWTAVGGTIAFVAGEAGHPGIIRRTTSTTINTIAYTRLPVSSACPFLPAESFDVRFLVRVNQADAETTVRYGLTSDATSLTPTNGLYLERLAADTNWFGVCRATTETREDTLVAMGTGWTWLRVRRVNATTIGFTVGSAAEVSETLTIPTAALTPFFQVTNTAAADKTIDIDRFAVVLTGLVR